MSAFRRTLAALLAALVIAPALSACAAEDGPEPAMNAFLAGWASGNLNDVGLIRPTGEKVAAADVATEIKSLSGTLATVAPQLELAEKPQVIEDLAVAQVKVVQPVPGEDRVWEYATEVRLSKAKDGWRVIWEPKVLHPQLLLGDHLETRRISAKRAGVLDGDGAEIVKPRPVVAIGVHPSKVTDLDGLIKELTSIFDAGKVDIDLSDLAKKVKAADPEHFVEVVTLRREAYDPIRDRLRALGGMLFRESDQLLAPTRTFARALLGHVGPVTKEVMDANPGAYQVGDQAGLSGLQRQYDERLRGAPGLKIVITRQAPDGSQHDTTVHTFEATHGVPLKTTLNPTVQTAAEQALSKTDKRSAMVAIRISDGAILAVANSGPENLAFTAQAPPGSTFKPVTALGLLEAGKVTPDTIVACPKYITVEGRQFKNAGAKSYELGDVPFRTDFARSCNTAFISLAPQLGADGLAQAGALLGLGLDWELGTEVFTGKVSQGGSATEQAAASFGQGKTVVSPIALAGAAAAMARGQWKQPALLLDPAPAGTAPDAEPLKQSTVDAMKLMMREVITKGTAQTLLSVPGGPLYGKTGTAEFDDNPAHTHTWFLGWQGDIAFAIFVEQGTKSGQTTFPITSTFLTNLAR